jgi:hypothetical protein
MNNQSEEGLKAAQAFYEALLAGSRDAYVEDSPDLEFVGLDGDFDLVKAVQQFARPTSIDPGDEELIRELHDLASDYGHNLELDERRLLRRAADRLSVLSGKS